MMLGLKKSGLPRLSVGLIVISPLVFLHTGLRDIVETHMALHMLLQFPLLMVAGMSAMRLCAGHFCRLRLAWESINVHGLMTVAIVSCVALYWMLPVALDESLMSRSVAGFKYSSWFLAGCALAAGPPRRMPVHVFFVGNMVWMLATAGLLYVEADSRLCVNYRFQDQAVTGLGLLAASCLILVLAGARALLAHQRPATDASVGPLGKQASRRKGTPER
ncbi:MAG: hypothetical protein Q7T87_12565 [Polaromonas sp.]|nr:hypothetical protein [Polaromonas sp.]